MRDFLLFAKCNVNTFDSVVNMKLCSLTQKGTNKVIVRDFLIRRCQVNYFNGNSISIFYQLS